eukprot:3765124-Prymnesium_polylepis.1
MCLDEGWTQLQSPATLRRGVARRASVRVRRGLCARRAGGERAQAVAPPRPASSERASTTRAPCAARRRTSRTSR